MNYHDPVPMLQGWRCTHCQVAGDIECASNDDAGYCWDLIVRAHDRLSPDCRSTKFLIVSTWRQNEKGKGERRIA
jgi:hypothetical protein